MEIRILGDGIHTMTHLIQKNIPNDWPGSAPISSSEIYVLLTPELIARIERLESMMEKYEK